MESEVRLRGARSARVTGALAQRTVDPEWLSRTIGAIYDCAVQPGNWPSTLSAICTEFSFASAVMDIVRVGPVAHTFLIDFGIDAEYRQRFPDYVADSIEMWGGRTAIETWPLEEPAVANQIIPIERKRTNRYYIDILEPRGFTDGVVLPLARESNVFCYFGLNRHVSDGDVSPDVVDGLRLLAPHFRRAVTIGNLLDLQSIERATFESVFETLSCGVILVDENLAVVHANRSASNMQAMANIVSVQHGRLVVHSPHAQAALQMAVQYAAGNEAQMSRRGIGIPVMGTGGASAVLHVLPLCRGRIRAGLVQRAVAAVFIAAPAQSAHGIVDAISVMHDLTPAENLVFACLANGKSLIKTAEALGIAKSTARTHLLRIFQKTGCKRQAELVALAARHALTV
jgi:DNA-binding CsgD family transcriptional regulator/PAS domain-containing protein